MSTKGALEHRLERNGGNPELHAILGGTGGIGTVRVRYEDFKMHPTGNFPLIGIPVIPLEDFSPGSHAILYLRKMHARCGPRSPELPSVVYAASPGKLTVQNRRAVFDGVELPLPIDISQYVAGMAGDHDVASLLVSEWDFDPDVVHLPEVGEIKIYDGLFDRRPSPLGVAYHEGIAGPQIRRIDAAYHN